MRLVYGIPSLSNWGDLLGLRQWLRCCRLWFVKGVSWWQCLRPLLSAKKYRFDVSRPLRSKPTLPTHVLRRGLYVSPQRYCPQECSDSLQVCFTLALAPTGCVMIKHADSSSCSGWARKSESKGKLRHKGGKLWGILRLARLRYLSLSWRIREAGSQRTRRQ